MRHVKISVLLAASALTVAAFVGVSSASAESFEANEAGEEISTEIVETPVLTIEGSNVECEEASLAGETEGKETAEQILSPTYSKCKAFGFSAATVTTAGCRYGYKAATTGSPGHATYRLFGCPNATKGIQIDVNIPFIARVIVDIPHQSFNTAARYTNTTTPLAAVDIKRTATNVMYDVTTCTGLCPLKVGTGTDATTTGQTRVFRLTHNP